MPGHPLTRLDASGRVVDAGHLGSSLLCYRFVDRHDFQYMEMDTDSAYMALTGSLHDVARPELRETFYGTYGEWFPRPYCQAHRDDFIRIKLTEYNGGAPWTIADCCQATLRYDTRTPGLFKNEFEGHGMIALNFKTYICWGEEGDKYSSKGLSKTTNTFTRECFEAVLATTTPKSGTNKGFVVKDNRMLTYTQLRSGLTYFYAKRKVLEDGVSTVSIDR